MILPDKLRARLRVDKGDSVDFTEMPNCFVGTPNDPSVAGRVEVGREFMHAYRDAFHELAVALSRVQRRAWLPYGEGPAEHGETPGIRDERLFESSLMRPRDKAKYEKSDMQELAAAYA